MLELLMQRNITKLKLKQWKINNLLKMTAPLMTENFEINNSRRRPQKLKRVETLLIM